MIGGGDDGEDDDDDGTCKDGSFNSGKAVECCLLQRSFLVQSCVYRWNNCS